MSKTKRKAETVKAPRDRAEAEAFLAEIGTAQRQLSVIEAALAEATAAAKVRAEAEAQPHNALIEERTRGLQLWAEANRAALTADGKTKTVQLATGDVAWRQLPPSVRITKLPEVIAALHRLGLGRFLRTKVEVDKQAMLKEAEVATTVPGVTIGSVGEEFVVAPAGMPLAKAAA